MPLLAPVMHPISVRIHHFQVPIRLLWDDWEKFITGDDLTLVPPTRVAGAQGVLDDYLGLPPQAAGKEVLSFPADAYFKIWYDYYRDQELYPSNLPNPPTDGIQKITYAKDYVTTARPEPTRRADAVTIPVNDDEVQVEDLRDALAKYRFDEARSRFGNRYTEYLRFLGIKPSDARLQRAEYLGGGSSTINFSEVLNTSATETEPQGYLTGHGVAGLRTRPFTRFFEEHGIFMTMLSIRPLGVYSQQIQREWFKTTKDDYWQKENQFLGMQEMRTREVYADNTVADDTIFGYNDRHYEYRRGVNRLSSQMRTGYDYWHLGRSYSGHPGLTNGFITVEPVFNRRIFADQTSDGFIFACNHKIAARRLVAKDPTPRVM